RARRGLDGRGAAELGEGSLGTDASVMRPGADELTGHDRADSQLAEQLGGESTDQLVELDLEFGGLPLAGQRPACSGPQSYYGGGLLHTSSRRVAQPGAGVQQLSQRQGAEPLAKSVRGAGDQRMQSRDGPGPEHNRLPAGGQQHPDGFPVSAAAPLPARPTGGG